MLKNCLWLLKLGLKPTPVQNQQCLRFIFNQITAQDPRYYLFIACSAMTSLVCAINKSITAEITPCIVKPKAARIASQQSRVIKQTHVMTIKGVEINIYDIDFPV